MYENVQLKAENSKLRETLNKAYDFMKQFVVDGRNLLERFLVIVRSELCQMFMQESECLDRDTLFEILEDLSMRYVDIDNEDFEFEVQEIAKKALKKIEKGPFNESRVS